MQALSLYILVRLDEGETEYNNFDALLVTTVIVGLAPVSCLSSTNITQAIATQFNSIETDIMRNTQPALYNHSLETSWKDWILEESARRYVGILPYLVYVTS